MLRPLSMGFWVYRVFLFLFFVFTATHAVAGTRWKCRKALTLPELYEKLPLQTKEKPKLPLYKVTFFGKSKKIPAELPSIVTDGYPELTGHKWKKGELAFITPWFAETKDAEFVPKIIDHLESDYKFESHERPYSDNWKSFYNYTIAVEFPNPTKEEILVLAMLMHTTKYSSHPSSWFLKKDSQDWSKIFKELTAEEFEKLTIDELIDLFGKNSDLSFLKSKISDNEKRVLFHLARVEHQALKHHIDFVRHIVLSSRLANKELLSFFKKQDDSLSLDILAYAFGLSDFIGPLNEGKWKKRSWRSTIQSEDKIISIGGAFIFFLGGSVYSVPPQVTIFKDLGRITPDTLANWNRIRSGDWLDSGYFAHQQHFEDFLQQTAIEELSRARDLERTTGIPAAVDLSSVAINAKAEEIYQRYLKIIKRRYSDVQIIWLPGFNGHRLPYLVTIITLPPNTHFTSEVIFFLLANHRGSNFRWLHYTERTIFSCETPLF